MAHIPWNKGRIFSQPKICKVNGCTKSAHYKDWGKKGYCANHIALLRRNGKPEFIKPKRLNGEGTVAYGYKIVTIKGKQMPEHRYLMEQHLGRKLKPHPLEVIHHLNGNKLDNRLENLILTNQSDHLHIHEYKGFRTAVSKSCSQCHKILSFSLFSRSKSSKDGYRPNCKSCQNKYNLSRLKRLAI